MRAVETEQYLRTAPSTLEHAGEYELLSPDVAAVTLPQERLDTERIQRRGGDGEGEGRSR